MGKTRTIHAPGLACKNHRQSCRLYLSLVRLRRMKLIFELLGELLSWMIPGPKKREQRTRNQNWHKWG